MESSRAGDRAFRAVLFDMDNTLFDLVKAKRRACQKVCHFLGRDDGEDLFHYFLRPVFDYESHAHIRDYLCDLGICPEDPVAAPGEKSQPDIFSAACRIFEEEKLAGIAPYPGIGETLSALRDLGVPMGIVTDAWREQARARLGRSGLSGYFDVVITFEVTGRKKPSHAPFLAALADVGARPGEVLLVGDSLRRDIAPGRELGITTAYASYGDANIFSSSPAVPDYILSDIRDLLALFPPLPGHESRL